jgi:sphingomyelin phosphodiesterase acid-like 3
MPHCFRYRSAFLLQLSLASAFTAAAFATAAAAQAAPPLPPVSSLDTAQILMLSDIHFDPFHDPTLVPQLVAAKVKDWPKILATPATPESAKAYKDLQKTCNAKGSDTDYALFASSLAAEKTQLPTPLFVTVSGDLMAHQFDCRFKALVPNGTEKQYSDFAANTVAFVVQQLRGSFPAAPVYFALGNNDSGCKDYHEDSGSAYLKADARAFAEASGDSEVLKDFPALGDYKAKLPKPFINTSLLVMQDIFEARKYETCGGKEPLGNMTPGEAQIAWLRKQLDEARAHHEHVWVMAHIPPGVDAYSTVTKSAKGKGSCAFATPELFLNSELFADTLADYADVISLVLLGHTHMDEMKLYTARSGTGGAPGKLVPSISPVNGNHPAFTIGSVDPAKAVLLDYTVYVATNLTGIASKWSPEYTYSTTYKQPDYSAASLKAIMDGFLADRTSQSPQTQAYESFYFPSGNAGGLNLRAAALGIVWPAYACSLTNDTTKSFVECSCPTK